MARITVVTATYNLIENGRRETFLQAVQSVQDQTHDDIEHLVIDGASTDGTVELLEELTAEGRITRYVSEPDTGIYNAMNRGAELASGGYIIYLNSDDYYHRREGLAEISAAADQGGYGFVCSPVVILDDPPWITKVSRFYARVLLTMPFGHPGMAISKATFQEFGGFDEAFKLASDYDLILRLIMAGVSSRALDEAFVSYRLGGFSDDATFRFDEYKKVMKKNFPQFVNLSDADWEASLSKQKTPSRVLLGILASPRSRVNIRLIALYQLLRNATRKGR